MNTRNFLATVALLVAASVPSLVSAQNPLKIDPNRAKIHPRQTQIHPRRLAFNNKDGRHQPRVFGKKDRHTVRKNVRGVTHHVTTPHHPAPKKG